MNANAQEILEHDPKKVASVALKTFFNIMDVWSVKNDKQMNLLGRPSDSTFFNWKKKVSALPLDTLEPISYVMGIYKALGVLFLTRKQADEWIGKDNQAFDGESALDYMTKGSMIQLIHVRRYLDAQRG